MVLSAAHTCLSSHSSEESRLPEPHFPGAPRLPPLAAIELKSGSQKLFTEHQPRGLCRLAGCPTLGGPSLLDRVCSSLLPTHTCQQLRLQKSKKTLLNLWPQFITAFSTHSLPQRKISRLCGSHPHKEKLPKSGGWLRDLSPTPPTPEGARSNLPWPLQVRTVWCGEPRTGPQIGGVCFLNQ